MLMMSPFRSGNSTQLPQQGLLMHKISAFMLGNRSRWPSRGAADAHDVGVQVGQSDPLAARGAADAYDDVDLGQGLLMLMMSAFSSGNRTHSPQERVGHRSRLIK